MGNLEIYELLEKLDRYVQDEDSVIKLLYYLLKDAILKLMIKELRKNKHYQWLIMSVFKTIPN